MTNLSPTSSLRARVVFASFHPGRVVIDLMGDECARTPITLEAFIPHKLWAVAAAIKLDQWARSSVEVELQIVWSGGKPRAKLSDGTSLMLIDLRGVALSPQGVTLHPAEAGAASDRQR